MAKVDLNRVIQSYRSIYKEMRDDVLTEFNEGRIKASEYSRVLESLMSTAMQLAFKVPLEDYQICLTQAQIENTKRLTYKVDDDEMNQLLATQLQGWATAYKSGMLESIPDIVKNDEMSMLYTTIKEHLKKAEWKKDSCGIEPVQLSDANNCNSIQGN